MNKNRSIALALLLAAVLLLTAVACGAPKAAASKDPPPQVTLNGQALNLDTLKVSDLNAAGYYMGVNDNILSGKAYKKLLAYYKDPGDKTTLAGGASLINRSTAPKPYVDCNVFELSFRWKNNDGAPTGVDMTYEGHVLLGLTLVEVIALLGQPAERPTDDRMLYRSPEGRYTSELIFDPDESRLLYLEIRREEPGLTTA